MPPTVARQASGRLQKMALEIQRANKVAVNRAAFAAKQQIAAEIRRVAPSGRLRGVGSPPGAKVGVRYDVKGTKNPTALVRALGPLHLVENPSKPHTIIPKKTGRGAKGKGSKRANKQALYNALFGGQYVGQKPLKTPYGPRFKVEHPGVRNPRRPWQRGVQKAQRPAARELDRSYIEAFRRGAT